MILVVLRKIKHQVGFYFKFWLIPLTVIILSCSHKKHSTYIYEETDNKIEERNFIHFIDSTTEMLGLPATELGLYLGKVKTVAMTKKNRQVDDSLVDSLQIYYNELVNTYDKAIQNTSFLYEVGGSDSIKNNFIILLQKGEKPWTTVIPVYIKLFKQGLSSLTSEEKNVIKTAGSIFLKSGQDALVWSKMLGAQMDEFEKKYNLKSPN